MKNQKLIPDTPLQVLDTVIKKFGLKVTSYSIDWLISNPEFPSVYSFGQLFERLRLKHAIIQVSSHEFSELPMPIIAHTNYNDAKFFTFIAEINSDAIKIMNAGKLITLSKQDFLPYLSGVVMIFDLSGNEQENDFVKNKIKEVVNQIKLPLFLASLSLIFGLTLLSKDLNLSNSLFICTNIIGFTNSLILLIHTFDENNSLIKKICSFKQKNSKINCFHILASKGAKLFGVFYWSEIGFIYFFTLLLVLLIFPNKEANSLLGFISILTAPYILYSIWYQRLIIGTWCRLCLFVLTCLFANFILALTLVDWNNLTIPGNKVIGLILIAFFLSSGYGFLKPIIEGWMKAKKELPSLKRLKFDREVFPILQKRQKLIELPNYLNPILYGNSDGFHKITIVSNPLCKPCQNAHRVLFAMLKYKKNTSISEVIIGLDRNEEAYKTSLLMLQLNRQLEAEQFLEEIELFYSSYDNKPEQWRKRFSDLKLHDTTLIETLYRQNQWCDDHKITSAPVIFYNNRVVSGIYAIEDLDYLVD
jgi:uncharacterized membrane protein/glutaredoxin